MKKITTLMVMLMGCVFSALAQTVANTATAVSDLKSGYYMLMVKSDDGITDDHGNYAYNTSDGYVSYEDQGSSTNFLGKTLTSADEFSYVFYVDIAQDGKLSIRAWKDKNLWWKDCGTATYRTKTPWNQTQFPTSSSKASFDASEVGTYGCYLQVNGSVWSGGFFGGSAISTKYNVVCNDANQMGYAQTASANNKAQFKFYAVINVPDPDQVVSFTYNYTDGEHSKSVAKSMQLIGYDFPEANDIDFLVGSKPAGKITADDKDKTFTIPCTEYLPFQTSTDANPIYYYLENVQGEGTRLYANGSSLAFRTAEQAANVNDVRNDLWYVTGNVFDGFQFHNVATSNVAYSALEMSHSTALSFSSVFNSCAVWDLFKFGNNWGLCAHTGTEYYEFGFVTAHYLNDSNKKNYSWKLEGNSVTFKGIDFTNDAFAFRLVPATFTYPMYAVSDGNTYNTFAAPFAVALADDEAEVKMFKGQVDHTGKELVLTQVDAVPANAGVMLMGEHSQADQVTFKVVADAENLEDNDLVGTTVEVAAAELADKLILGVSDETGEVGFFSANASVASLDANHAYLNKTNAAMQTLSVRLAGQTTGIGHVSLTPVGQADAPIYDLTGRRVNLTVKGQLYIQNGRKFIAQ